MKQTNTNPAPENRSPASRALHAVSKIVRVLTVAPIMALATLSVIYLVRPEIYGGLLSYGCAVLFLTVFPLLAYPLQKIIPPLRRQGRDGQRNLAIAMAVLGYIGGLAAAAVLPTTLELWVLYLTYFLSGVGIVLFNKGFKIKASGHACGVAGPMFLLVYYIGWKALFCLLILALVYATSLQMKRHTLSQLLWGTVIPLCALGLAILVATFGIKPLIAPQTA